MRSRRPRRGEPSRPAHAPSPRLRFALLTPDPPLPRADAGAPVRGPPPPPQALAEDVESGPEIETLIDAAKYGDLEAVEDFIDVGKGLDEADVEQRTALHFAAGAGHGAVVQALVAAGADQAARDSKGEFSNACWRWPAGDEPAGRRAGR